MINTDKKLIYTDSHQPFDYTQGRTELVEVQKTASKAVLVNLARMLNGWIDTLGSNISQILYFVKLKANTGVDLPGVEPGRFGVSIQPSKPARPTPFSLSQIFTKIAMLLAITLLFTFGVKPVFATNTGQFTAEVWVKPATSVASKAILGKSEEMRIFTDASGFVGCQIKVTTWQTAATATTNALALNTWAHVACSYDKANIKVYVNGTQVATQAQTNPPDDTANNFLIGEDDSASTTYTNFIGTVDNFQFYNYAINQKQINADMNAGGGSAQIRSVSAKNPVGYWKFDEGQGTTANNSGNGGSTLNGTLTSMSSPATSTSGWTNSGKFSKALLFDGQNDYIAIANNASINNIANATIDLWIKLNSLSAATIPISKDGDSGYYIQINTNGRLYLRYGTAAGNVGAVGDITTGNWIHLVMVFNNGVLTAYKNGVLLSGSASGSAPTGMNDNLWVGAYSPDGGASPTGYWVNGSIDEVKVYNYALTSDEIKTDYNKGSSLIMGAAGNNSSYAPQASNQQYCVPGDATSCVAPVGEWSFDKGSGSTVADSSGNNNTGTWNGTGTKHWDVGKIGSGGKFNGSNDYVDAGTAIVPSTGLTIEAWVNINSMPSEGPYLIAGKIDKFELELWGGNYKKFILGVATQNNGWEAGISLAQMTTTVTTNTWYHVVGTYDTAGTTKFYINGQEKATSSSTSGNLLSTTGETFFISRRGSLYFNGLIDQVRIFNYARSAAQVAWDYNQGKPVGWWKMDECQGSVANDSSGNKNNGTITVATGNPLGTCTTSSTSWGSGATGKYNSSLSFDGTDDYVSVGDPSSGILDFTGSLTLSLWVKKSDTGSYRRLITKETGTTGYGLYFTNTDILDFFFWDNTGTVHDTTTTPVFTSTSNWYHIVAIHSSGSGQQIYVNGVLQPLGAGGSFTQVGSATTASLYLGASNSLTQIFNGQIDDVKIFNYALTPLQIKNLYNNGAVNFGPSTGSP